jgi:hypothetical protein
MGRREVSKVETTSSVLQVDMPYLRPRLGARCCSLPLGASGAAFTGPVSLHVRFQLSTLHGPETGSTSSRTS